MNVTFCVHPYHLQTCGTYIYPDNPDIIGERMETNEINVIDEFEEYMCKPFEKEMEHYFKTISKENGENNKEASK